MSMTGFAAREGGADGWNWVWELRSVNGRGLDLRLRLPDWAGALEQPLRKAVQGVATRGNVTLTLRVQRDEGAAGLAVNANALERALELVQATEARAEARGMVLAPIRATDVMGLKGVIEAGAAETDTGPILKALEADFPHVLEAFAAMRSEEGAALEALIRDQLGQVAEALADARVVVADRADHAAQSFRASLARVIEAGVDEARVAQEIAMLAVKADVTEELDRLEAHVAAARALLDGGGPRGRKLDFLTQELNREANTLCAKSAYAELTRIGLDLKHTIDQMREQVQNVE